MTTPDCMALGAAAAFYLDALQSRCELKRRDYEKSRSHRAHACSLGARV